MNVRIPTQANGYNITQVGTMVREARHLFLHKGCCFPNA